MTKEELVGLIAVYILDNQETLRQELSILNLFESGKAKGSMRPKDYKDLDVQVKKNQQFFCEIFEQKKSEDLR